MRLNPKRTASVALTYTFEGHSLPVTTQFSDLGVFYNDPFSYTFYVSKIVNKAAGRANCICSSSRDSLLLTLAFCTFVRPILEYSSITWSPYYTNGINKIEAVQRLFKKAIGNLRSFKYSERLQYLNLDSLQCRRVIMLTKLSVTKYYMAWLILSPNVY